MKLREALANGAVSHEVLTQQVLRLPEAERALPPVTFSEALNAQQTREEEKRRREGSKKHAKEKKSPGGGPQTVVGASIGWEHETGPFWMYQEVNLPWFLTFLCVSLGM